MTRGGGGGKGEEAAGKVMGPLFPRLHVSDAGKGGGPRAPPRNKMALYEQFTVPSSRFSSSASARAGSGGGGFTPSTSASQVYGYERPMFQPFNVPSDVPIHSYKKINGNSMNRQVSSRRNESGRLSSQTNNNGVYAAGSAVECTSQHRGKNVTKNSSGKLANDDQFMVPSIDSPRCPQHSTQEHAEAQQKWNTLRATGPQRNPPATSKSSAKCYNAADKHLEIINISDIRSVRSPKAKEKEPAQALKTVEAEEMPSILVSKEKFGSKVDKVCLMRDKASNANNSGKPHPGSTGCQAASMNGSSMETQNPTTSKDTVSCNPCTDLDITNNRNSYLPMESLKEDGTKRKRSLGHHGAKQNDDLSDSVESIPEWEISSDQIVDAIGQKHFWKARRAIQNQQRIFAVQVFELHKLIKVQKSIAASPHVLIEGDPYLGNVSVGKKQPDGKLKAQTLSVTNKEVMHPSTDQLDLTKENTEGNLPYPSHDDGLDGNHHSQVTTDRAFTSNPTGTPAAPGNKQNNWCVNPPQNQWLVPVMSPSEGLVYKPYSGPCPPAGSLLAPFYANFTPLSLPSTAYGVPMPHQQQYIAPSGAPAMPVNYFPPFNLPVMNPEAPASAVEQGSHAAASQHNGNIQSGISCNMSHPGGIWKFYASRDSEPQASSASSPSDRLQGDGSGPVSLFPAASVQNAQPQPSSASQEKQNHVIRVVPHNAQTASESAAWIFRSIQMERQQSDL